MVARQKDDGDRAWRCVRHAVVLPALAPLSARRPPRRPLPTRRLRRAPHRTGCRPRLGSTTTVSRTTRGASSDVTPKRLRELRRGALLTLTPGPPLGRLHGRSPTRIQALAADVLRERVAGRSCGSPRRRGGALTWRWRSQQSDHVQVHAGPQRLQSPTQTRGRFTARLRRPDRYMFICTIHAPGMRMTADVS